MYHLKGMLNLKSGDSNTFQLWLKQTGCALLCLHSLKAPVDRITNMNGEWQGCNSSSGLCMPSICTKIVIWQGEVSSGQQHILPSKPLWWAGQSDNPAPHLQCQSDFLANPDPILPPTPLLLIPLAFVLSKTLLGWRGQRRHFVTYSYSYLCSLIVPAEPCKDSFGGGFLRVFKESHLLEMVGAGWARWRSRPPPILWLNLT